ncbi:hypothetical protein T492DRAFT_1149585 [Pavlovales sp. CCMP2436]|nr:hypothetical protein T492DRAFT_1149585 [Pavlovales sp. CCMP2436]
MSMVQFPDEAEHETELTLLGDEEEEAVAAARAQFSQRRQAATGAFKARMAEARAIEMVLRQRLEEERFSRDAARVAEDDAIKAVELTRIAVEYEAQRLRDEAGQAEEQAALGKELGRQLAIQAAAQPVASAQADTLEHSGPTGSKFENTQYRFEGGLTEKLKAFKRASAGNSALVLSIEHDAGEIRLQAEYSDTKLDAIAADLSESIPTYILYTLRWEHEDGRTQYPFCLVGFMPQAVPPHLRVMYARPVTDLRDHLAVNRHFTCEDIEDLTQEWLVYKLEGGC